MNSQELEQLAAASRKAAFLSTLGMVIIFSSLGYSAFKLSKFDKVIKEKQQTIEEKQRLLEDLEATYQKRELSIKNQTMVIADLKRTQDDILDFLAATLDQSKEDSILAPDVDWDSVKKNILKLRSGKRKNSILTAILLSWKKIPFKLGQQSLNTGFDSPRFIEFVLRKNGITIKKAKNERVSDALMRSFKKIDKPQPGDLVFYKGRIGSFGFIYVSDGKASNAGVGVGTFQSSDPLQIINLDNINTPDFPLIGYFRVVYPDEAI